MTTPHAAIDRVIDDRCLRVVFQPIVQLADGNVFAYEALVRSCLPDFTSPPALLDAAVAAGRCGELGRVIREKAVSECPTHPLFLNVHPAELDDRWLVRPDDPLVTHDCGVFLEITESVPITHFKFCQTILRELRGRGVQLAVDDLGAGYSNLKYIADLAPEVVKLDRELIANLHEQVRLQRLVSSIVDLCRAQGAAVVAEGIETTDELHAVIDCGAQYGQGYLLARPASTPPQVTNWQHLSMRAPASSGAPPTTTKAPRRRTVEPPLLAHGRRPASAPPKGQTRNSTTEAKPKA